MRLECAARLGSAAQHGLRVVSPPGGWLDTIHHALVMAVRELQGREASPTLGIIDSQTVKVMAPAGPRGYDNAKKINGRKRHILADNLGHLLAVLVTDGAVQDRIDALVAAIPKGVQAERRRLMQEYRRGMLEGGEGYNPYADWSAPLSLMLLRKRCPEIAQQLEAFLD